MMLSLTGFKNHFTPSWQMVLLTSFVLLLLIRLGFWQLERAHEKQEILKIAKQAEHQAPVTWLPGSLLPKPSQQIIVKGEFLQALILYDNQHYNHQFGYHVLSPLMLSDNSIVLIDRGWVQGDKRREQFPEIKTPDSPIEITGKVYYPSEKTFLLGPIIEEKKEDLAIVEWIDTNIVSQFLHKPVYPFIIRLEKHQAHGFIREWAAVSMSPQRHYAYAMQWFAMAFVVFVLFVVLNFKKR